VLSSKDGLYRRENHFPSDLSSSKRACSYMAFCIVFCLSWVRTLLVLCLPYELEEMIFKLTGCH